MIRAVVVLVLFLVPRVAFALDIDLPTPNRALFDGRDEDFFQPTAAGDPESGKYGCVRMDASGPRFHEGIDIKAVRRDRHGEAIDPVMAISAGTVVFLNALPGKSSYGRYIVLRHNWDGVEVFSLYAHLRSIEDGLREGMPVQKGQKIGTLGRSGTQRISRDRAHLHLEICLMYSPHFQIWYPRREPKAPPFGNFNGRNLAGLDPVALFRAAKSDPKLNFREYLARIPIAFSVTAANGMEYSFDCYGVPLKIAPATEKIGTIRVNETLISSCDCRIFVRKSPRGHWQLTENGRELVEMMTFAP
jgi:murein DD-endopeptidase MepM/ murein hydrolase activator NlpD